MSYRQYRAISTAAQRSFARGKEFGGWLLDDGGVEWRKGGGSDHIDLSPKPKNAILGFHTHPGNPATGQPSLSDLLRGHNVHKSNMWVIGRASFYSHGGSFRSNWFDYSTLGSSSRFNPFYFNYYFNHGN